MKNSFNSVLKGISLSRQDAYQVAKKLIEADLPSEQIAGFLVALRMKDETSDELLGFVDAFRETAPKFSEKSDILMDVCGTGGDHANTFNVSTGVALVLASLKIKIAKHGNRGVSSQSGSADVLEALRIKSDHDVSQVTQSLSEHQISFLFAPSFYPVFAKIAQVRKRLGVYTLFNALGPILNPAPLTHQMMGVYDEKLLQKVGEVLRAKGLARAYVLRGEDGLDEVSISGPTQVMSLENGALSKFSVSPETFGLKCSPLSDVQGGTPAQNAVILEEIFKGVRSPKRDLIVINSAMGLLLSGFEKDPKTATQKVAQALDSGATFALLEKLRTKGRA